MKVTGSLAPGKWGELRPSRLVYITGAFQLNIPIQADADILPFDMNTLAIFKWRPSRMPLTNRWYPVMKRFIEILSAGMALPLLSVA
jgi:hypothetical protein